MGYNFDDENENKDEGGAGGEVISMEKRRKPFAYWTVGGKEYKLKLTTTEICRLEEKMKRNLLDVLFSSGSVPPLTVMLGIVHGAMKTWHHGIKYEDVQKMFDRYCEEGGTQMTFMVDVLMEVYKVSGFFSENQAETMDAKMEEVKEQM